MDQVKWLNQTSLTQDMHKHNQIDKDFKNDALNH